MTVLANAPIDAATGLPIPTIAVATAGGVSVIKHDNTVINLLTTSGNQNSISFTASKGLETHGGGGVAFFGWGWYSMPQASTNTSDYLISDNAWSTTNIRRPGSNGNSVLYPMTTTNYGIAIREAAGVSTTDKLILIALTNPAGYSLQSYLTTKYNTGWMPGDIRGAWLSDNTAETVVGEKLSSNTFYNTGWTTSGAGDFVINANGTVTVTGTGNKTESYLQSPTFTTTVGKTYVISVRTSSASGTGIGIYAYGTGGPNAYVWDRDFVFVSTASSTNFFLYRFGGHTGSASITSISVKEADLDRSVNKNPLQVFGSITKTRSFKAAALILINVPLALIGGFVGLWVFSIPLSVSAAIGFIALSGQAVLNGVVMLSVFQQLRNAGYSVLDAVKEGAMQRLRTVLMTAMLAALGLLPMAVSHDIGSETQRPLAIVVIGGLITATLLTLVVLPVLYVVWFSKDKLKDHNA